MIVRLCSRVNSNFLSFRIYSTVAKFHFLTHKLSFAVVKGFKFTYLTKIIFLLYFLYWKSFINQYQNYTRNSMFYTGSGKIFSDSSIILILVYEVFPIGYLFSVFVSHCHNSIRIILIQPDLLRRTVYPSVSALITVKLEAEFSSQRMDS